MGDFLHGVEVIDISTDKRPITTVASSTIGIVGTAPDADEKAFPLNTPVLFTGYDTDKLAKLGSKGTLPWSLDSIFQQFGANIVVIRVYRTPSAEKISTLKSLTRPIVVVTEEDVVRATGNDKDAVQNTDIVGFDKLWAGSETYEKNVDWQRNGHDIEWIRKSVVETVNKGAATVDELQHQNILLKIKQVYQGDTIYVENTDYEKDSATGGVKWLGTSQPNERSNYYVSYEYGKRPATGSSYKASYSYYDYARTEETVTRVSGSNLDGLARYDIVSFEKVFVGDKTYVLNTDYQLDETKNKIEWLNNNTVDTITRQTGTDIDALLHSDILLGVVAITQGAETFVKDTDWQITVDGKIEWLTANKPLDGEQYSVEYSYGDRPSAGTSYTVKYSYKLGELTAISKVIGRINPDNGGYEGLHALKAAESAVKIKPKIIIAPGFTQFREVANEMLDIAERLKAIALIDAPNTTDEQAINYRGQFNSKRAYIIDPWHKYLNGSEVDIQPTSAKIAGLIAKTDAEKGFWYSPSNKEINACLGPARPIEFAIGDKNSRANKLNENEVATIITADGSYRLWGNRTTSNNPKYIFLNAVRVDDLIEESLQKSILWAVDQNLSKTFFDAVVDAVSAYIRSLAAKGAVIIGQKQPCWIDQELNTVDSLLQGKAVFSFDYDRPYPAEHITLQRFINHEYLKTIVEA